MYRKMLSHYITMLYCSFADFISDKLQEIELNYGLLFFPSQKGLPHLLAEALFTYNKVSH